MMKLRLLSCLLSMLYAFYGINALAMSEEVQIACKLRDLKNSMQVIVIEQFGPTPEAKTIQGRRFIQLTEKRIELLEQAIVAALAANWNDSQRIETAYLASNAEFAYLEQSFEFFKNLE